MVAWYPLNSKTKPWTNKLWWTAQSSVVFCATNLNKRKTIRVHKTRSSSKLLSKKIQTSKRKLTLRQRLSKPKRMLSRNLSLNRWNQVERRGLTQVLAKVSKAKRSQTSKRLFYQCRKWTYCHQLCSLSVAQALSSMQKSLTLKLISQMATPRVLLRSSSSRNFKGWMRWIVTYLRSSCLQNWCQGVLVFTMLAFYKSWKSLLRSCSVMDT